MLKDNHLNLNFLPEVSEANLPQVSSFRIFIKDEQKKTKNEILKQQKQIEDIGR